jgi:hypothetical protein
VTVAGVVVVVDRLVEEGTVVLMIISISLAQKNCELTVACTLVDVSVVIIVVKIELVEKAVFVTVVVGVGAVVVT